MNCKSPDPAPLSLEQPPRQSEVRRVSKLRDPRPGVKTSSASLAGWVALEQAA